MLLENYENTREPSPCVLGVWFLKNHAMDNDYYCVAAHINRENSYNSYIKDNRNIGIKGKLSYSPIERTNSTDFIERIDRIENIK